MGGRNITPNKTFHITSQTLRSHKLEDMFNDLQKAKVVYYRKGPKAKPIKEAINTLAPA